MKPFGIIPVFLTLGCGVVLEADPRADAVADAESVVDATPVDAASEAGAPDAGCLPVPARVRFDDVPVGEVATLAVPIGCGQGLVLESARLVQAVPADAFSLPDPVPAGPVPQIRITYRPRLVAEQASAVLLLVAGGDEYAVPVAASARWTDAACRHWEVAALATGLEGAYRLEATPPAGVAPTAAQVVWALTEVPDGSEATVAEDFVAGRVGPGEPDDPSTPGAWLSLDIEGLYEVECTVKPPAASGCPVQQTRLRLERCPCRDDLRLRLTWEVVGAGEVPADLDLHLLHPDAAAWGAPGLDCHGGDPDPRWREDAGALGRPTHTGNDATSPGFEGIQLARVAADGALAGPYRVAVEARTATTVEATLQIFLAERMVWRRTLTLPGPGWWDAAAIGWHRGALVAAPIDRTLAAAPAPDPWAPLPGGTACLPAQPPACEPGFVCRDDDGALVGHCRR